MEIWYEIEKILIKLWNLFYVKVIGEILGEEVIRDTDGKYVVKESSTIHQALGGFCF